MPKVIVLLAAVKPVPLIVIVLPTAPAEGERDEMNGVAAAGLGVGVAVGVGVVVGVGVGDAQLPAIWFSGVPQFAFLVGTRPSTGKLASALLAATICEKVKPQE